MTLDLAREDSISWEEAVDKFNVAKGKVLLLREGIKKTKNSWMIFIKKERVLRRVN